VKPDLTDSEAIRLACQEGFTTKSNVRNRGAGLSNLIRYVTQRNGGTVLIAAGKGELSAVHGLTDPKITARTSQGFYPGTLVKIILRTNAFQPIAADAELEPFEW
jgi:hypothetical protein